MGRSNPPIKTTKAILDQVFQAAWADLSSESFRNLGEDEALKVRLRRKLLAMVVGGMRDPELMRQTALAAFPLKRDVNEKGQREGR
jgi:hypothetical protein